MASPSATKPATADIHSKGEFTREETGEPDAAFPEDEEPTCVELQSDFVACPDGETLRAWAAEHHVGEPAEETLAPELDPPDPLIVRDGLVVYDEFLKGMARRTRTHLELWPNTPTYSEKELERFRDDAELWREVVKFREDARSDQIRALRKAIHAKDRRHLRAYLLRNGVFYVEDPITAAYAARYVGLRLLFDVEELELRRAGKSFLLKRTKRGSYVHAEPLLDRAYAAIHMLDRVGVPGTLAPIPTYGLQEMRRRHGLDNVVAGAESESGREAVVRFFDGTEFDGVLILGADGRGRLAVLGDPTSVGATRERNLVDRNTLCDLFAMTDLMVRERLDFDEPEVEFGQQDGRLRPLFDKAYAAGEKTYEFNGVTYDVYDNKGRPQVPQVCIDFITDAVQRMHGSWWKSKNEPSAKVNTFEMRDYMPYRTVRSLLELGRARPHVAQVRSLPAKEHVPYKRRTAFFDNLWRLRDDIRDGDIAVIYGLRADNKNHFHTVYVRETDPIYGVPTVLTANPGFARVQAWHDVMWESPKRSVQHVVRWNPDWLRSPQAVDRAAEVVGGARTFVESLESQREQPSD